MIKREEWRPVVGFPGYEISNLGKVRSRMKRWGGVPGRVKSIAQSVGRTGYLRVGLSRAGYRYRRSVHRLVLKAFSGRCPKGKQASHLNGDRSDNRACNLAWETPRQNSARKIDHGTLSYGERHYCAKLTEANVVLMRQRHAGGESYTSLAAEFGVAIQVARKAIMGQSWRHVGSDT